MCASWQRFAPYVPVARRRALAAKTAAKVAKTGSPLQPVVIAGSKIAHTFWGQAWCKHLESFSDFANRLPRGRTYARHGAVIDLQLTRGKITAQIMGSQLYQAAITVTPLAPAHWQAIKQACAGKIDSLVELLQGRLSDAVMRVITHRDEGLFPQPGEIALECSCPDWADLCKHLAAVLYGVGARLDTQPELLFLLRGVDHLELVEQAASAGAQAAKGGAGMAESDLADVFGIEITTAATPPAASAAPIVSAAVPEPAAPKVARKKPRVPVSKAGRGKKKPAPRSTGKTPWSPPPTARRTKRAK
jgi:uncharacterized Zn finger protein